MKICISHCRNRSLVGGVKYMEALCYNRALLNKCGFEKVEISYIGGLKVLLCFKDLNRAKTFQEEKEPEWRVWFTSMIL
jgi:hypothetical protein